MNARGFQLSVLIVVAAAGIFARTALGPLQETIRRALLLSDTQMALLQGPALAMPLLVVAAPLGWIVDRYSRSGLLRTATLLNVVATAAAALASGFVPLFAARCMVGIAAPATAIATYSLLADWYPPAQRGRATMAVMLGQVAGSSAAFALGGQWLSVSAPGPAPWRVVLVGMSAVLIPIGVLTLLLREPKRTERILERPSPRTLLSELWRLRVLVLTLVSGMTMVNLADGAALVWGAPTLTRGFGLSPDRVGTLMALALLGSGICGPVLAGPLADFCQRKGGPRRTKRLLSVLALLSVPMGLFAVLPDAVSAIVVLGLFLCVGVAMNVLVTALSVVIIPNELRGLCMTLQFAAGAIFGLGLAPLAVPPLSAALGGEHAIGPALALLCVTAGLIGALIFAYPARLPSIPGANASREIEARADPCP